MQYIMQLVAKISIITAILCSGSFFAMEKRSEQVSQMAHHLFDEQFNPTIELLDLLHRVGMPQEIVTINEINNWAQANLLRQGERWHKQTDKFESRKDELFPIFEELGFLNEIEPVPYIVYRPYDMQIQASPPCNLYDGVIIHGATLGRVRLRLHHLIQLWQNNVWFNDIYFLTGDRTLDSGKESAAQLLQDINSPLKIRANWQAPSELPHNETEMVKLVWEQSDIPAQLRASVKVHFISAPKKLDPKTGAMVRPTTDDTADCFFKVAKPGRYMAVSNQPYVARQDLAVRARMPEGFILDTVGVNISAYEKVGIVLDELARLIYLCNKVAVQKQSNDGVDA